MPNIFSHPYQLDDSIFNLRVVGGIFIFIQILKDTNGCKQWGTWSDAAFVLHCLRCPTKRTLGLYGLI